jgi:hypothetical protein
MEDTKPNVTQGATGGGDAGAGAGAGNDTKPEDGGSTITIRIRDQTGEETFFKVKRSTKMDKVFKAYADVGVPARIFLSPFHRLTAHPSHFLLTAQGRSVQFFAIHARWRPCGGERNSRAT